MAIEVTSVPAIFVVVALLVYLIAVTIHLNSLRNTENIGDLNETTISTFFYISAVMAGIIGLVLMGQFASIFAVRKGVDTGSFSKGLARPKVVKNTQ
jgi:high-affinity nickel permease